MSRELSKNLMCIAIRGGIEKWVEKDRADKIMAQANKGMKFFELDGEYFNTVEITGVFTPQTMEERTRRKNGQWQCKHMKWHDKGEVCEHNIPVEPIKGKIDEERGVFVAEPVDNAS